MASGAGASRPACVICGRGGLCTEAWGVDALPGVWVASVVGEPRHIEGSRLRRLASDLRADASIARGDLEVLFTASVLGA